MALKQIIIVDEDGSKWTVESSEEPYYHQKVVKGQLRAELGVAAPLSSVLKAVVREEWRKVRETGARLVKLTFRHKSV